MWKRPFSFLGAGLQGLGSGVMEVGRQECPVEMLLRKTLPASGRHKDTREDFTPTNTSLVAVSMRLPNGEAEDGLKLSERWIRRVSLLVKPLLCSELWSPLFLLCWPGNSGAAVAISRWVRVVEDWKAQGHFLPGQTAQIWIMILDNICSPSLGGVFILDFKENSACAIPVPHPPSTVFHKHLAPSLIRMHCRPCLRLPYLFPAPTILMDEEEFWLGIVSWVVTLGSIL